MKEGEIDAAQVLERREVMAPEGKQGGRQGGDKKEGRGLGTKAGALFGAGQMNRLALLKDASQHLGMKGGWGCKEF